MRKVRRDDLPHMPLARAEPRRIRNIAGRAVTQEHGVEFLGKFE